MSDMGQHQSTGRDKNMGKRSRANEPAERGFSVPVSLDTTGMEQVFARLEARLAALAARHDALVVQVRASEHDLSRLEQRRSALEGQDAGSDS